MSQSQYPHLILSRRAGEKVVIDFSTLYPLTAPMDEQDTSLTLCTRSISAQTIKLDFYAPANIKIWRHEIWQRLK